MMIWVKHYTNATDKSEKLGRLIANHGSQKYGEYWLLLEAIGSRFEGSDKFSETFISIHDAKAKLRIKTEKKLIETLQVFADEALLTFKKDGKFLKIVCPILYELQNKHSKYNKKRSESNDHKTTLDKKKNKNKEEEKEEEIELDQISEKHPSVKADQVIQLFNDMLAGKAGKIKFCHGLSSKQLQEFVKTSGYRECSTLDAWKNIFAIVANSEFLNGTAPGSKFLVTLNWLIEHGNVLKVLNGQYDQNPGAKVIPGKFSKAEHRVPTPLTDEEIKLLKDAGHL